MNRVKGHLLEHYEGLIYEGSHREVKSTCPDCSLQALSSDATLADIIL